MKIIRNMINSNKGFFSFWLVLFFLNAGFAKNIAGIATAKPQKEATENRTTGSKHDLTAIADADSDSGFFDQLKKGLDTDDLEFTFFGAFSSKPIVRFQPQQQYADISMRPEIYKGSLYDLYCNWKFHLA